MNITEIIPTELSGYCDVATGECVTAEADAPQDTTTENIARTGDEFRRTNHRNDKTMTNQRQACHSNPHPSCRGSG